MESKFDWGTKPGPSVFVKDKKFNGINQRKAESATKQLELNPNASHIELGSRQVTPYQVAGPFKKRKKEI